MSTLSFHTDADLENRIRKAAEKRQMPLSSFLKETVANALEGSAQKGADLRGIVSGKSRLRPEDAALPPWNDNDPHLR